MRMNRLDKNYLDKNPIIIFCPLSPLDKNYYKNTPPLRGGVFFIEVFFVQGVGECLRGWLDRN